MIAQPTTEEQGQLHNVGKTSSNLKVNSIVINPADKVGDKMRLTIIALMFVAASSTQAQTTPEDCLIIDGLDTLHAVQTRLSRNHNQFMFQTDIRIIRAEFSMLSERDTLIAVDSSRFSSKGSAFINLLRNTETLLQGVSLDDPDGIQPHFTPDVRANLTAVGQQLATVRCTGAEVRLARRDAQARASSRAEDDGEPDDAAEILREAAEELINFTNLFIFIGLATATVLGRRLIRYLVKRKKRRAKRHTVIYASEYGTEDGMSEGVMIDINCFGCKLRHSEDAPISEGVVVRLQIEQETVEGVVIWTNIHYAGIQFKRPLSLETVKAICDAPIAPPENENGAQEDAA